MAWLQEFHPVLWFLISFGTLLCTGVIWLVRQRSGVTREISEARLKAKEDVDRHGVRLDRLEQDVSVMRHCVDKQPDMEAIHSLSIQMTKQAGSMDALRVSIKGVEAGMRRIEKIVERHDEHLLSERNR